MINKEIILGNGNIVKDFSDRSIPQNSHNQVCVSFLIPSNQFNEFDDYSVFTAVSRVVGNVETPLNALVLTASKSITIEGINYIKFSCVLSLDYTNVIGELRFSPYIQATIHTDSVLDDLDNDEEEVITETLLNQNSYTNCKLNVIKAVRIQEDASLEEASTATTLAGQINSKKIYYNAEWNSIAVGQENTLYYNIATSYNPSVALYNGSIVVIKNQNETSFYFPYLNGANVELLKRTNDGVFYKISGISRTGAGTEESPYVYNATKEKITYSKSEVDSALDLKVDKTTTINDKPLSSDITLAKGDIGLGNVANYGVETTLPTASGDQLYITSKAVYDALQDLNLTITLALSGKADTTDITSLDSRLDAIETLIGDNDGDQDNIINTLKEVISALSGLGEDANILNLINSKANQSDLTTLNNQINGEDGIKDKVDILSERENAYMEIKNSLGTIDIAVSDWVVNADANYPYKWELTNGYLEGAVNCIVVYSKDSDTSMLSATTGIDEENGKLIIYASELPSDTISIEKIAVFNDLNSYINYSNEIVQQVLQNTSAISDINNVKLPQYVKKELQDSGYYTQVNNYNETGNRVVGLGFAKIVGSERKISFANVEEGVITLGHQDIANNTGHSLTFDANGDLKVDGNAVGGGGKQMYRHHIFIKTSSASFSGRICVIIEDDDNTAYNYTKLANYLKDNGFDDYNKLYVCGGAYLNINNSKKGIMTGLYCTTPAGHIDSEAFVLDDGTLSNGLWIDNTWTYVDTIETL